MKRERNHRLCFARAGWHHNRGNAFRHLPMPQGRVQAADLRRTEPWLCIVVIKDLLFHESELIYPRPKNSRRCRLKFRFVVRLETFQR